LLDRRLLERASIFTEDVQEILSGTSLIPVGEGERTGLFSQFGSKELSGTEFENREVGSIAMKRWLVVGLLFVVAIVLIFAIAFWTDSAHWFLRYTGADAESGTWYGFWSGFGGAIPDFLILGSIITVYRHHNCHVKGCLRLGKPVEGTPYLACPAHHPAHEGDKRSVSEEVIKLAHKAHLEREAS
jgi:hypothetical protein